MPSDQAVKRTRTMLLNAMEETPSKRNLQFRLHESELDVLQTAANRLGISKAKVLRGLIMKYASKIS